MKNPKLTKFRVLQQLSEGQLSKEKCFQEILSNDTIVTGGYCPIQYKSRIQSEKKSNPCRKTPNKLWLSVKKDHNLSSYQAIFGGQIALKNG